MNFGTVVAHYLLNSRSGVTYGDAKFKDSIINDGLYDPYNEILMGGCAEILNDEEKIENVFKVFEKAVITSSFVG